MHIYTYTCRIHIDARIKTGEDFFKKIYLSLYLKGLCVRGSWRTNRTATYWPPLLWPSALCLSRSPGLLNWRPGGPLYWMLAFSTASCHQTLRSPKLTDFLSLLSYILVQCPPYLWNGMFDRHQVEITVMQFTGHSLPVHQFVTVPWDFNPVPYCQLDSPTPMEYALPPSLEWHVWPGRRSIYNIWTLKLKAEKKEENRKIFSLKEQILHPQIHHNFFIFRRKEKQTTKHTHTHTKI